MPFVGCVTRAPIIIIDSPRVILTIMSAAPRAWDVSDPGDPRQSPSLSVRHHNIITKPTHFHTFQVLKKNNRYGIWFVQVSDKMELT